jgi:ubiquinone/menaquinone biosynthesis C-methylase UbiE
VYDAWYETPLGAAAHRIESSLIAALASPRRGERALDVGCGTGIYTSWLADLGVDAVGVDHDSAMLARAHEKAPGARLVEGDATALPFADGEFDLVLAVTVLCFLDAVERAAAVRELVRVARPEGRVVIGELARHSLWAAQRRLKGWRGSTTWRSARFTTGGELRRLLLGAGAARVDVRHGLYLPPWDVPSLVARADAIERLAGPLGPIGAAFVVARAAPPV